MRRVLIPLVVLLGGLLARPGAAAPLLIHFQGTIAGIEDAGGWAAEFELLLGEPVEAVYQLEPEAGVIEFGDGRHGARLPSGGRVVAGNYRTGLGLGGNILVFDDCWIGERECVAAQGGDAYFVQLTGGSNSGVDLELLISLTSMDASILGGDDGITLLPPDPRQFDEATFRWILTDGVRASEITASVGSLRVVPEPATFLFALLGFALVVRQEVARGKTGATRLYATHPRVTETTPAPKLERFSSWKRCVPEFLTSFDRWIGACPEPVLSFASKVTNVQKTLAIAFAIVAGLPGAARAQDEIVVVGGTGRHCGEDPGCINRLHPDIPMAAKAVPGQTIFFKARNASDFDLDPESTYDDPRRGDPEGGTVHPLAGPVAIEGATAGDVLAVTLLDISPGPYGYTSVSSIGFVTDHVTGPYRVLWRLNRTEAVTDDIPGVRIPNASFPGIVTVLPGREQLDAMLARESELADAGGAVRRPSPLHASPDAVCGPGGTRADECLRTGPPREHGGNMDIRYLQVGVTVYLPCYIDGCGLAIGDPHFAQGDGEVSGTAIEMDADFAVTTRVIKDGPALNRGPHYEGPVRVLDIPSRRFYATTGFPLKEDGEVPPDMRYLQSEKIAGLRNLSKDVSLAARNALLEMIDYMAETYGLTAEQAYIIASVAVDLRIAQLVDAPNVGVTAILPLDIFSGR